jgi:hypothetical protein
MSSKLVRSALVSAALLAVLSACGQAKVQGTADTDVKPSQAQSNAAALEQTAKPSDQDADKQAKVKAYFGDENGENLLEQELTITYKQESDKYAAALNALTKSPNEKQIALMKGISIKSARLNNQLLSVDLSIAPEGRLGAGGEKLLLEAMKKTVFQFSEIQSLDIKVDGNAVDSLMGHMELPHPIKRN